MRLPARDTAWAAIVWVLAYTIARRPLHPPTRIVIITRKATP